MPNLCSKARILVIFLTFGLAAASQTLTKLRPVPEPEDDDSLSFESDLLSNSLVLDSSPLEMEAQMLVQAYTRLLDAVQTAKTDSLDSYLTLQTRIKQALQSLVSLAEQKKGGLDLDYLLTDTWGFDLSKRIAQTKKASGNFDLGPDSYFGLHVQDIVDAVAQALGPSDALQTTRTLASTLYNALTSSDASDFPKGFIRKTALGPLPTFQADLPKDSQESRGIAARVWDLLTETQPSDESSLLSWFTGIRPHLSQVFGLTPKTYLALSFGRKIFVSDLLPASQTEYFAVVYHYLIDFAVQKKATKILKFCPAFDHYLDKKKQDLGDLPFYLIAKIHLAGVARENDYPIEFAENSDEELESITALFEADDWKYFREAVDQAFELHAGWKPHDDWGYFYRLSRLLTIMRFYPGSHSMPKYPGSAASSIFWVKNWVSGKQII